MKDQLVKRHVFNFTEESNGGESFTLTTNFYHNGDPVDGIYFTQELSLQSYGNSAAFHLNGLLNPEKLRELADELEGIIEKEVQEI